MDKDEIIILELNDVELGHIDASTPDEFNKQLGERLDEYQKARHAKKPSNDNKKRSA